MALRVLMAQKNKRDKEAALEQLTREAAGFEAREAELAADIEAAQTDEERAVVEEAVNAFEQERSRNTAAAEQLRSEIAALEEQIRAAEDNAREARNGPGAKEERTEPPMTDNQTRTNFFGMTLQQRDAFLARQDVKDFLGHVRELKGQTRAVTGAELGIPTIMLDVLREHMAKYSKLITRVRYKPLKGKARQNIAGTVPEAVWTESVASLNELELSFHQIEVDGFKVGGYVAIPNSTLEDDDDLGLARDVMEMLGQAMGKAVDKAIVYGTGSKMPVGYMTRLAATTKPAWWGTNQGTFKALNTTNLRKVDAAAKTGVEFFQQLITALGVADPKYSVSGEATWVMNRKTHMDILSRCLAFNAAAALTAGMQNVMPVIGGEIVEIEGVPDHEISGGFLDCYTLVERAGASVRSSDIPMMIQDMTVFVATQRMDGKPAIGEAFVAVNYANATVTTTATFAEDAANTGAAASEE